MTDTDTTAATEFDISELEDSDEAVLAIKDGKGKKTTWLWTFYGPGHPKTVAVSNRMMKRFLDEAREKERAQVNGKKWSPDDESYDDIRRLNIKNIVDRLKSFTPVKLNGETITFSPEAATELLLDPSKSKILGQVQEFLQGENIFTKPSAQS